MPLYANAGRLQAPKSVQRASGETLQNIRRNRRPDANPCPTTVSSESIRTIAMSELISNGHQSTTLPDCNLNPWQPTAEFPDSGPIKLCLNRPLRTRTVGSVWGATVRSRRLRGCAEGASRLRVGLNLSRVKAMVAYWFPALRHEGGSCVGLRPSPFVQLQTMWPAASAVGVKMSSPCLVLTVSTILFGSSDS